MPDVSPPWWNLGHTSWFFAKNVLEPRGLYVDGDRRLEFVLNSYYETHGRRIERAKRGLVTRPTTDEILAFRRAVDERMEELLMSAEEADLEDLGFLVATGVQHEQQHQELLVTEVKHILGCNVPELREPYVERNGRPALRSTPSPRFVDIEAGLHDFGNLEGGWCWDNELPVHRAWVEHFGLFNRLVTNAEYLEFIDDGGYDDALLWLANGWTTAQEEGWRAPLYWRHSDGGWTSWTLAGERPIEPHEPVCHVSFYEADAYARWRRLRGGLWEGARLPTERELEQAARATSADPSRGNFVESCLFHPRAAEDAGGVLQLFGDLWEWTTSHYEPYPGYRPFEGDLMEYNGKFMDNQRVLRGGSCATPADHMRISYRNFWPAGTRFQFTGIRLARDPG